MFGDSEFEERLAEALLSDFEFSDILELNDLSDQEVLEILIRGGYISQPETYINQFEDEDLND